MNDTVGISGDWYIPDLQDWVTLWIWDDNECGGIGS